MNFDSLLMLLLQLSVFGFMVWLLLQVSKPEILNKIIIGVAVIAVVYFLITNYAKYLN